MALPILKIKPSAVKRVRTGHPWIFSNEIIQPPKGLDPGQPVDIKNRSGDWVGRGYFNPRTLIAVRLFTHERVVIDDQFLEQKIATAEAVRKKYCPGEEASRLVFGEADGLPGLIVDRYGSVLVTQFLTAGMDRLTERVVAILVNPLRWWPAMIRPRASCKAFRRKNASCMGTFHRPSSFIKMDSRLRWTSGKGRKPAFSWISPKIIAY